MLFRSVEADPFPRFSFPRASPTKDVAATSTVAPVSSSFYFDRHYQRADGVSPSGSTQRDLESGIDPLDWIASALHTPQPSSTPTNQPEAQHVSAPPAAVLSTSRGGGLPEKDPKILQQWKQRLVTEANATSHDALLQRVRAEARTLGDFTHVPSHHQQSLRAAPSYAQPTASSSQQRRGRTPPPSNKATSGRTDAHQQRAEDTTRWATQQRYTPAAARPSTTTARHTHTSPSQGGAKRLQRFLVDPSDALLAQPLTRRQTDNLLQQQQRQQQQQRRAESPIPADPHASPSGVGGDVGTVSWTIPQLSNSVAVSSTAPSMSSRGHSIASSTAAAAVLAATLAPPPQSTLDAAAAVGISYPFVRHPVDAAAAHHFDARVARATVTRDVHRGTHHNLGGVSPEDVMEAIRSLKREELGDEDEDGIENEGAHAMRDLFSLSPSRSPQHHVLASPPHGVLSSSAMPFRYDRLAPPPPPPPAQYQEQLESWQLQQQNQVTGDVCCPCCYHVFSPGAHRVHNASSP